MIRDNAVNHNLISLEAELITSITSFAGLSEGFIEWLQYRLKCEMYTKRQEIPLF
ncbi:hypothetical protein D3C81_2040500 [compost metagenome]